jgi:predicted outer membrane repeat protein
MRKLLGLALIGTGLLHGATVTLCGSDTQAGAGVNFAAAMKSGGIINFSCGPSGGTIRLSQTYTISSRTVISAGGNVLLDVDPAHTPLTMFRIVGSVELMLQTISLRNPTTIIAIGDTGTVTLDRCQVLASANGFTLGEGSFTATGGSFENGVGYTILARNVRLSDTRVTGSATPILSVGGSVSITNGSFLGGGPVVCLSGQLNIAGSQFTNLSATGQTVTYRESSKSAARVLRLNDGGAISSGCTTAIANSAFSGNRATVGGAIAASSASLSISGSQFSSNHATSGGAIGFDAPANNGQTLSLRHVTFDSNTADQGGAVYLGTGGGTTLNASGVAFSANSAAHDGGAIGGANATVGVGQGVFVGNQAGGSGGAVGLVLNTPQTVVFANTLFARNSSAAGASVFSGPAARFLNCTIAANPGTAVNLTAGAPAVPGTISFVKTILSQNGANCAANGAGLKFQNDGHNLQFPDSTCGGSIAAANPLLDSLFIPAPGSPAFKGGDNAICSAQPVNKIDLFGQIRPRIDICTIGAIEGEIENRIRRTASLDPEKRIPPIGADFVLASSPVGQTVAAGGNAAYAITAAGVNLFGGTVRFSAAGVPAGATAIFSPDVGKASSLTIATTASTLPGVYVVTVIGRSGALYHTRNITMSVTKPN